MEKGRRRTLAHHLKQLARGLGGGGPPCRQALQALN